MKDPKRIIQDVEKLDEMEFNPVQQPQLNEKVLKEKCKKLRETFERMPHAPSNIVIQDIPLPGAQPPSILKKTSAYGPPTRAVSVLPLLGHGVPHLPPGRKPPGPPLGPLPPQVLQMYGCKVGFALDLPARRRDEGMLYSPELAQWGHDDDVSSTSEDDGYPEDTEQDKHDDSPEDSDSDRSDGESEGGAFVHRDDTERDNNEEKKKQADDTSAATIETKATATVSAKPQITNPKAAITRFVPAALRVRQGNKGAAAAAQRKSEDDSAVPPAKTAPKSGPSVPVSVQTKDDVREAFMKEMEGLL
ncbi:hypothetical protein MJT46_001801 [Ovis ammon polii x Ovis aries]|nr:hypothetical protein MJT46_001801 [Ovis ammon polii x Ovis aries]